MHTPALASVRYSGAVSQYWQNSPGAGLVTHTGAQNPTWTFSYYTGHAFPIFTRYPLPAVTCETWCVDLKAWYLKWCNNNLVKIISGSVEGAHYDVCSVSLWGVHWYHFNNKVVLLVYYLLWFQAICGWILPSLSNAASFDQYNICSLNVKFLEKW